MAAFIAWCKATWASLHNNPVFVTATSLFVGALGKELYTAWQTGNFDFSAASLKQMAGAAIGTTLVALYHLYIVPKNPTVQATFPPSTEPVKVAAQLEPVNPQAVPVNPHP